MLSDPIPSARDSWRLAPGALRFGGRVPVEGLPFFLEALIEFGHLVFESRFIEIDFLAYLLAAGERKIGDEHQAQRPVAEKRPDYGFHEEPLSLFRTGRQVFSVGHRLPECVARPLGELRQGEHPCPGKLVLDQLRPVGEPAPRAR